jgi:hypothetical protein
MSNTQDMNNYRPLLASIERALVDRQQEVELGAFRFRYLKRGEELDSEDGTARALQSGIFIRLLAYRAGAFVGGRWAYLGQSSDIAALLEPYLTPLAERDRQELHVQLAAATAIGVDRRWHTGGEQANEEGVANRERQHQRA